MGKTPLACCNRPSLQHHRSRGLSLVAIVVAGLTFAFGEGGSNACACRRALRRRNGLSPQ